MATCTRAVWKVVSGCQRLIAARPLYNSLSRPTVNIQPARSFAAVKPKTKGKKDEGEKEVKKKRVIDDTGRHKPFGKTAWAPVDDVYILQFYPRILHQAEEAVELLKTYQRLDFTPKHQPVYINLQLNMKLEKKKKVDPFVSTLHLPHPFRTDMNKVLVFTEDAAQARVAQENGAAFVGGTELIQQILDDDISAHFYIAVPEILSKLVPLKNKLRKKFPKSKRGTVGVNIPKMLNLFKTGHEYMVQNDCKIQTMVAMLDMPSEHILANLETIIKDVCSHKPADLGPFIERAILTSQTSEALWINTEAFLPKTTEETNEE